MQIAEDKAEKQRPDTGPIVPITVDNNVRQIHRGSQTVSEIKNAGGVPQAFALDQLIDGKLTELPDGGRVTIKGGEVFVSHPKDSGSS